MNGRYRDFLRETLQEQVRKVNFVRIYPARGCEVYDQYFVTPRPSNKIIQRYLYYDDLIPYPAGMFPSSHPATKDPLRSHHLDPNQLPLGHQLANGGIVVASTSSQMNLVGDQKMPLSNNTHRRSSAFIKGSTYRGTERASEQSPQKRQPQVPKLEVIGKKEEVVVGESQ